MKFNELYKLLIEEKDNTPESILESMKDIEYGIITKDGEKLGRSVGKNLTPENFYNDWYLQSPNELLKNKIGVCWDQVELERKLFEKTDYNFKTIYVELKSKNEDTHTFLVFEKDDGWYWFEHSWDKNKGIHGPFKDHLEIVDKVVGEMQKDNDFELNIATEYSKPKYGISCQEFMDYCKSQTRLNEDPNVYNPPYPLEKIPKHLQEDPVHRWRAINGIELIHKEPDLKEFERIVKNWSLMTPEQKKKSDVKSIELFGKNNEDRIEEIRKLYK
jgi:hypothetical protein